MVNDSWSLDWSLLPAADKPQKQQQQQEPKFFGFSTDEKKLINTQLNSMKNNENCRKGI